jgi:hypothetical protein
MIRFAAALALVVTSGAAFADPAMTIHATSMRAAPSSHAHFVQRIPARAQIDVRDCGEYWCAASWRDLDGYVRVDAIGANHGPLATRPPGYYGYGGPAFVGPAFGFGFYRRYYW